MSDIIYTPPASSGGGQNPTANFIPLNNGTANFVDSNIFNDFNNNILKSVFYGNGCGFKLDFFNSEYYLGDFEFVNNGTRLEVLDGIEIIKTKYHNNDIGFYLDFVNFQFIFGDINNDFNGTKILMDDNYRYINIIANPITFWIDGLMNVSYFNYNGNDVGLKLDFANNLYFLGDYAGLTNSTQIIIDDGGKNITLWAENSLALKGAGLQSASAGGNSGDHLVIYLNGTQYKIALLNP